MRVCGRELGALLRGCNSLVNCEKSCSKRMESVYDGGSRVSEEIALMSCAEMTYVGRKELGMSVRLIGRACRLSVLAGSAWHGV